MFTESKVKTENIVANTESTAPARRVELNAAGELIPSSRWGDGDGRESTQDGIPMPKDEKAVVAFCTGTARHSGREHAPLRLSGWYTAMPNTAMRSFTITGDVD